MSGPGPKAEKLKAKQWGFSSEKSELFADDPPAPARARRVTFPFSLWHGRPWGRLLPVFDRIPIATVAKPSLSISRPKGWPSPKLATPLV
jgi:hypothetical protein